MPSITIDGKSIEFRPGESIISAATRQQVEIPYYCWHPRLSVAANCRMCLVELEKAPKLVPACQTECKEGMVVKTQTDKVKDMQRAVHEMLLINHPIDCPICDQAGECKLQEHSTAYGRGYSRFVEQKNVKPKRTQLGPRVTLDDERCVLCSRCIRFSKEVAKDDVLGFIDRGSYSTLTCYPGKKLENNYSLNTVDI